MRVLVDSNILLCQLQFDSPQHDAAVEAVARIRDRDDVPVVATQNLAEWWTVVTRGKEENGMGYPTEAARSEFGRVLRFYPRLADHDEAFAVWRDLIVRYGVRGRSCHDARLVATMIVNDVRRLLTFNVGDFARYREITVEKIV